MNKNLLPYDIYERHKKVGSLINIDESILDVGGQLNMLSQFCHPSKIVVANLKNSDELSNITVSNGPNLPFKNSSFSTVCAIDVLEHIPKTNRERFIYDLIRVSFDKVIISFPIGTKRHIVYEKETLIWLQSAGRDIKYLKEHVSLGLPTRQEISKITLNLNKRLFYSGNLTLNKLLFRIFIFDPNIPLIRKPIYYLKLVMNLFTNPIIYLLLSRKSYHENVVRAYLIIKKK